MVSALQMLQRPEADYATLRAMGLGDPGLPPEWVEQVEIEAKYAGYIARQQQQVERMSRLERWQLPASLDYRRITGMRNEAVEKLERFRPATLGQASRIQGVNPADISVLMVHMEKARRRSTEEGNDI